MKKTTLNLLQKVLPHFKKLHAHNKPPPTTTAITTKICGFSLQANSTGCVTAPVGEF
jgi:hypothetical protein